MERGLQSVIAVIHGEALSVLGDRLLPLSRKGQSIPGVLVHVCVSVSVSRASRPSSGSSLGQPSCSGSLPLSVNLCEFVTQLLEKFVDSEL